MARTPEAALLTERHRRLQLTLSAAALRDLLRLWGTVNPLDLSGTLVSFVQAGAVLVRAGRRASAAAASRYYVDFRRLEGVPGQLVLTLPAPLPVEIVEGGLRGAALKGVVTAWRAGRTPEQSADGGFVAMAGTASSLVLGGGREALMGAIRADPASQGWQRVTSGTCAFCRMLAGRGIGLGETFQAHDHCGCTAEPAFEGVGLRAENKRMADEWQAATGGRSGSEALNAYRQHLTAKAAQLAEGLPRMNISDEAAEAFETAASLWDDGLGAKLRRGAAFSGDELVVLDTMDTIMAGTTLQEKKVLYRGLVLAPDDPLSKTIAALKPGDTFVDRSFASTTWNKKLARRYADEHPLALAGDPNVLEIRAPAGTHASEAVAGEPDELVLDRDAAFRVVSRRGRAIVLDLVATRASRL